MSRFLSTTVIALALASSAAGADPLAWTELAKAKGKRSNGPIWSADPGQGRNSVVLFGGWTGTDAAVKHWADALASADAFADLDIGRIYAVPGPLDSGYSSVREVNTAALAADLIARAAANKPGLILLAAHSSGAFVADDFLMQVQKQQGAALLASVAFFKLDGGWSGSFNPALAKKLGGFYCVAARCGRVASRNFSPMTVTCPKLFGKATAHVITLAVEKTGCVAANCCHDALINTRPHNPKNFDVVKDYSDYAAGKVQTGWIEKAKAELQRQAAQDQ